MDYSELVESLVDMVGPRVDEDLARELASIQPGIWYVRQEEPSSREPAVILFERNQR